MLVCFHDVKLRAKGPTDLIGIAIAHSIALTRSEGAIWVLTLLIIQKNLDQKTILSHVCGCFVSAPDMARSSKIRIYSPFIVFVHVIVH